MLMMGIINDWDANSLQQTLGVGPGVEGRVAPCSDGCPGDSVMPQGENVH